jgi:hypothetical protein
VPLFTTRKPEIKEEEEEIVPCEDDLVIDDMDCDDFEEEVKKPSKPDKIVLVRKTQEDRDNERILV